MKEIAPRVTTSLNNRYLCWHWLIFVSRWGNKRADDEDNRGRLVREKVGLYVKSGSLTVEPSLL